MYELYCIMYTWQTSEETLEMVKTQVPVELGVYVLGYLNATIIKATSSLTIEIPLKQRPKKSKFSG